MAAGTKDDPWALKTPPGTSSYTMYQDEDVLVCQVGSTTLKYQFRAVDDLHEWLAEQGHWVPLGAADENSLPAEHASGSGPPASRRRLVRPAQGLPGPVRHVPAASAGGARPGRTHARPAQQPDARHLTVSFGQKSFSL